MELAAGGHRYCLDAEASAIHNGGRIQLWECNGWPNQEWYIDGARLINGANVINGNTPQGAFCLDAEASHIQNGGRIQLWECNGWPNQNWEYGLAPIDTILQNGNNPAFCLDAEASHITNGGPIQLFSCNSQPNQLWHFALA